MGAAVRFAGYGGDEEVCANEKRKDELFYG